MKNKKVTIYSLIALACLVLSFVIHWTFIIPAAILSGIGWKELISSKPSN